MTKIVRVRVKAYSYLIDDGSKDKDTKKCVIKWKLKFKKKNCLEATQLKNKIKYLEKNKINVESLKKS